MIVTAGAIDCHVHFICPQLAYEAISSGELQRSKYFRLNVMHTYMLAFCPHVNENIRRCLTSIFFIFPLTVTFKVPSFEI